MRFNFTIHTFKSGSKNGVIVFLSASIIIICLNFIIHYIFIIMVFTTVHTDTFNNNFPYIW